MKKKFSTLVNIYSVLAIVAGFAFALIMHSVFFTLISIGLGVITYIRLHKAINKHNIIRYSTYTVDYTEVFEAGKLIYRIDHK